MGGMKLKSLFLGIFFLIVSGFYMVSVQAESINPVEVWDSFHEDLYLEDHVLRKDNSILWWKQTPSTNIEESEISFTIESASKKEKKEWTVTVPAPSIYKIKYGITDEEKEYISVIIDENALETLYIYDLEGNKLIEKELGVTGTYFYETFVDSNGDIHLTNSVNPWKLDIDKLRIEETPFANLSYYAFYITTLKDGSMFFNTQDGLKKLNNSGDIEWVQTEVDGYATASPDGSLFIVDKDKESCEDELGNRIYTTAVYELEKNTGAVKWKTQINFTPYEYSMLEYSWLNSIEVIGNHAYVNTNGSIFMIDRETGNLINTYTVTQNENGKFIDKVTVSNNFIYLFKSYEVIIFDKNLNKKQEYPLGFINQMEVTPDGDIYVLHDSEKNSYLSALKNDQLQPLSNNNGQVAMKFSNANQILQGLNDEILFINGHEIIGFDEDEQQSIYYKTKDDIYIEGVQPLQALNTILVRYSSEDGTGFKTLSMNNDDSSYKLVDSDKDWTITFSQDVDTNTIIKKNIHVLNESGAEVVVDIKPGISASEIIVESPATGYSAGKYKLVINTNVLSNKGKPLKEETTHLFMVK